MEEVERKEEEGGYLNLLRNPTVGSQSRMPGSTDRLGGTTGRAEPTAKDVHLPALPVLPVPSKRYYRRPK